MSINMKIEEDQTTLRYSYIKRVVSFHTVQPFHFLFFFIITHMHSPKWHALIKDLVTKLIILKTNRVFFVCQINVFLFLCLIPPFRHELYPHGEPFSIGLQSITWAVKKIVKNLCGRRTCRNPITIVSIENKVLIHSKLLQNIDMSKNFRETIYCFITSVQVKNH